MNTRLLLLLGTVSIFGIASRGWTNSDPLPPASIQLLTDRIATLDARVRELETRLAKLESPAPVTPPPAHPPESTPHDWRSRALGHKNINGSRVYFLPLTQSRPK